MKHGSTKHTPQIVTFLLGVTFCALLVSQRTVTQYIQGAITSSQNSSPTELVRCCESPTGMRQCLPNCLSGWTEKTLPGYQSPMTNYLCAQPTTCLKPATNPNQGIKCTAYRYSQIITSITGNPIYDMQMVNNNCSNLAPLSSFKFCSAGCSVQSKKISMTNAKTIQKNGLTGYQATCAVIPTCVPSSTLSTGSNTTPGSTVNQTTPTVPVPSTTPQLSAPIVR